MTGHDWLYAVGDVNHRALLTHQGKYQARIAGAAIVTRAAGEPVRTEKWGAHTATADHAAVPQVVFTDPEAASVGLTLAEAEQAATGCGPWTSTCRRWRARACTATATGAGPAWSSISRRRSCAASPSSAPASAS